MKQKKPAPDMYLPKAEREKKQEVTLVFSPCLQCGKKITEGYYGRWLDGGVCSKTCNTIYAERRANECPPTTTGEAC